MNSYYLQEYLFPKLGTNYKRCKRASVLKLKQGCTFLGLTANYNYYKYLFYLWTQVSNETRVEWNSIINKQRKITNLEEIVPMAIFVKNKLSSKSQVYFKLKQNFILKTFVNK